MSQFNNWGCAETGSVSRGLLEVGLSRVLRRVCGPVCYLYEGTAYLPVWSTISQRDIYGPASVVPREGRKGRFALCKTHQNSQRWSFPNICPENVLKRLAIQWPSVVKRRSMLGNVRTHQVRFAVVRHSSVPPSNPKAGPEIGFLEIVIILLQSCWGTGGRAVRIFCCPAYLQTAGGDIGFPSAPSPAKRLSAATFNSWLLKWGSSCSVNLIQAHRCPCPSVSTHTNRSQSEHPLFALLC